MRFGLASYEFRNNDISFNLSQIEKAIKEAKEKDVQLLCFGETFLCNRKFLKSSEIVYNELEIKNDMTKERMVDSP